MADPEWETARKKRCFELFIKLKCVKNGVEAVDADDVDVTQLDEEKMTAHLIDCYAALGVVQQERIRKNQPLIVREGGQALSTDMQAVRNKVLKASIRVLDDELVHDGTLLPASGRPRAVKQLLRAFPDESKQTDGRGWLPLHWAIAMGMSAAGISEEEMKILYASDPMAFQRHHRQGTGGSDMGYTPAHLLCMQKLAEDCSSNMSLIKHFSIVNQRAFTMSASYPDRGDPSLYSYSALHAACNYGKLTEELLKHLLQLDSSQIKKSHEQDACTTPMGFLCTAGRHSLIDCLLEVDSSTEVVGNAVYGCVVLMNTRNFQLRMKAIEMLLKANPEAAKYHKSDGSNILHLTAANEKIQSQQCIDVMTHFLARHKDAVREVDEDGWLPVHHAARFSTAEVMDFLLGLYPGSASVVTTDGSSNLLRLAVRDTDNTTSVMEAKVRFLCSRYPAMLVQKDGEGDTPLHYAMICKNIPAVQILCEAGGPEQVRLLAAHPTKANHEYNGWLPLHYLINWNARSICDSLLSEAADCFRLFLRSYPEAAGIEGGVGAWYKNTPYQLAVDNDLPPYYLRLLLRAAPNLNPAELHRLNYAERRMAMFLAFGAVTSDTQILLLARLRFEKKDLLKHVMSFL